MAALFWVRGVRQEWKQFVENRVTTIRSLVDAQHWKHCPGKENPADIPSRGMSAVALVNTPLWLDGPDWLYRKDNPTEDDVDTTMPEDCRHEVKSKVAAHSLITLMSDSPNDTSGSSHDTPGLSHIIPPERHSSSYRVFRVTALVLKFVHCLRSRVNSPKSQPSPKTLFDQARLLWIKDSQLSLQRDVKFALWKRQLGLVLPLAYYY